MKLIPIKLLKNETDKNTLLNLISENCEIDKDDYIESRMLSDLRSRQLIILKMQVIWHDCIFIEMVYLKKLYKTYNTKLVKTLSFSVVL